jgi:hypothetical protein
MFFTEEYAQYYGQMNTMNGRMLTMKQQQQQHDGLPYEEMGYCPPPNRKLPPVPGQHSNYNTIDRIKNGRTAACPSRNFERMIVDEWTRNCE